VQSTKDAGEIKLTARADGIAPATAVLQAKAGTPVRLCRDSGRLTLMRVVQTHDWLELAVFRYSIQMSFCQLPHPAKFRPVLRSLAALPLIAGWLFPADLPAGAAPVVFIRHESAISDVPSK